jgi:hypothetical protein
MVLGPRDDVVCLSDHLSLVRDEDGDPSITGQPLLAASVVGPIEKVGQEASPVGLNDLRVVACLL